MACNQSTILVPDDQGGAWQLGVIPGGELQITKIVGPTPPTVSLIPFAGSTTMFNLSVLSATGQLVTTGVPTVGTPPMQFIFQATDCSRWSVFVDGTGILHDEVVPQAGASCPQLINDTAGQSWSLSAEVNGEIAINFNSNAPVAPLLIADYAGPSTIYELKYVVGSGLGLFLSSGTNVPLQLALDTPSASSKFLLQVVQGILVVVAGGLSAPVVIGQLYTGPGQYGDGSHPYPTPVQPGGIGTPVTSPAQAQGLVGPNKPDSLFPFNEITGRYRAGCGHSFNSYEIIKIFQCNTQVALVVCPLCRFIQNIYNPYSLVEQMPIVVG